MNKRDLIEYIYETLETTKSGSEEVVNAVLQGIQTGLKKEGSVTLAGFGTWTVRKRAARMGRNPQTGESIKIKASKTVGFKPAKAWKESL